MKMCEVHTKTWEKGERVEEIQREERLSKSMLEEEVSEEDE